LNVFKALGDSTRREILKLLSEKDMSAGEISEHFNMSKPAITKHLDILREAELITSEKVGLYVIYSINISVLQETISNFMTFFEKEKKNNE
jgi:ArsR family transcriptional regulator, arsenate/arsenite/antimonite-responsive transcriptional repressor